MLSLLRKWSDHSFEENEIRDFGAKFLLACMLRPKTLKGAYFILHVH